VPTPNVPNPIHPDPLAGTAYRALSFIGQGSFGLVLEAQHMALGTVVVVKLLHAHLADRPDLVDRLRLEAQAMSRLRSPHLALCTDLAVTPEGRPFLVLERLHGRTVADELEARGPLPVEEAIDVARQTLVGLAVVHEAGLVHRDVKPGNLFLCHGEGGRRLVKILDFGVAKVLAQEGQGDGPIPLRFPTEEGTAVGSPRSFSPEQARGRAVDARTDVYAAGIVLYALLTGKGPFDDCLTVTAIMHAHVFVVPPAPSRAALQVIPPELDAVVMRALAKSPDERFASARDFAAALALVPSGAAAGVDTEPLPVQRGRFGTEVMPPAPAARQAAIVPAQPDAPLESPCAAPPPAAAKAPPYALPILVAALGLPLIAALLAWAWLFR
jgi:serine/threonine-protein kinase